MQTAVETASTQTMSTRLRTEEDNVILTAQPSSDFDNLGQIFPSLSHNLAQPAPLSQIEQIVVGEHLSL